MIRSFRHRVPTGLTVAFIGCLTIPLAPPVHAQDVVGGFLELLFGRDEPQEAAMPTLEAIEKDVPADFANAFTPLLTKLLMAELHFAGKVCELDDEQLKTLHKAGKLKVAAISKLYEKEQNRRQSSEWPDARQLISDTLQERLDAMLPAEAAARYREEIAARRQAKKEATQEMMLMLLDRRLSLKPEQYEQVGQAIDNEWDPAWSRSMQIFLYDDYAPMPDPSSLSSILSEKQQSILSARTNHGRISFGWEQDLGLMTPWGDVGDLEVDIPAADSPPPEEAPKGEQ